VLYACTFFTVVDAAQLCLVGKVMTVSGFRGDHGLACLFPSLPKVVYW